MKGLKQFMSFDLEAFLAEKKLTVVGSGAYEEHETKKHLGIKLDCVITLDNTKYTFKDKPFTNLYEKISIKVTKDINVPLNSIVEPAGDNIKATVWGDYNNNLSVVCSDIKVLEAEPSKASSQGNSKILPNLN